MKSILTLKHVHILSLVTVVSVFMLAAVAYIEDQRSFVDVNGHSIEIGQCYYRNNFGILCPSCGLTRGFISLENFDLQGALYYNAMSPFVYLMFIFLGIYNFLSLLNHRFAKHFGKILALYAVTVCVLIVLRWLFYYFLPVLKML